MHVTTQHTHRERLCTLQALLLLGGALRLLRRRHLRQNLRRHERIQRILLIPVLRRPARTHQQHALAGDTLSMRLLGRTQPPVPALLQRSLGASALRWEVLIRALPDDERHMNKTENRPCC